MPSRRRRPKEVDVTAPSRCVVVRAPRPRTPLPAVRVWEVEHPIVGPAYALRTPRSPQFNSELTARVRPAHRSHQRESGTWYVRREYRICIGRLLKRFFGYDLPGETGANAA